MDSSLKWRTPGESFGFFLHDAHISRIEVEEGRVEFIFDEGFRVVDGDDVIEPETGRIRLSGCDSADFRLYLVKSRSSKKGLKFRGRQIELDDLRRLIDSGHKIELYEEHDERKRDGSIFGLVWIGEILPYRKGRKWNTLFLKVDGIDFVEFTWR